MTARVHIVGAGLAGLSCAHSLAQAGVPSTLVSTLPSERAQSVLAEGGINAALNVMGENDSVEEHIADTLASAAGIVNEAAVRGLCSAAPALIDELIGLGVPFQVEQGHLVQRYFGGQKKARTAYVQSSTGKALMSAFIDAVRGWEAQGLISRKAHHELAALAQSNNRCTGIWVRNSYTGELEYLEGPVVICAGGLSGVFGCQSTGTTTNTGDVAALCLAAGVELANLEMLQYHPTTVAIAAKRLLISEAARGEGGRLFVWRDNKPYYFMEERYPELGNLMPRDVISREEHRLLSDEQCGGIWLDLRGLSKGVWRTRLADLRKECRHYLALDPAKDPIPVEPGVHYSMGGIRVDTEHRTSMEALYAAGESACQYHGANRLGGNSLLGAIYGGKLAAQSVVSDLQSVSSKSSERDTSASTAEIGDDDLVVGPAAVLAHESADEAELCAIAKRALAIVRNASELEAGIVVCERYLAMECSPRLKNRAQLVCAMLKSALARKESRGAHTRSDYPEQDPTLAKQSVAKVHNDKLKISFEGAL